MKKILFLLPILALTACDKPTSTANLTCEFDWNWQNNNTIYLDTTPQGNHDIKITNANVKVVTFDTYAKVTANDITTIFEKVKEIKFEHEFGTINIVYQGNFPDSSRTALLTVQANIVDKTISSYDIEFTNIKVIDPDNKDDEITLSFNCTPISDNSSEKKIPFNHNYKMPGKIDKCISEICDKVYCLNMKCNALTIHIKGTTHDFDLSAEDALSISKNWDYSNMKRYLNDGKLEEHEKDACDVVDRLNKYIHDNKLDSSDFKTIEKAIENCGDKCEKVLATGEMGDYLIKVPETKELHEIANKQKNTKFLSVFNPNSYTQTGYCLVNILPLNTIQKLHMPNNYCHYRIYCGAPEYVNYDEFYAVEVCM